MREIRQLKALMRKNFILRYKADRFLLLELGVPLVIILIYYVVLTNIVDVINEEHSFPPVNSSFLHLKNLKGVVINYIPKSTLAENLLNILKASGAVVRGFSDFSDYLLHSERYPSLPLIVFSDLDNSTVDMPVNLRFQMLDQNYTLHLESLLLETSSAELYESPAIGTIQKLVTEAFMNYWRYRILPTSGSTYQLQIAQQKMSHSGKLPSIHALANLFSSLIICSCVPIIVNIVLVIVSERHLKFKEYMQLHNVSETIYWLSWGLVCVCSFLLVNLASFMLLVMNYLLHYLPRTNLLVVATLFIAHAVNCTSFCFLVASIVVNEATRTHIVILVIPFILYVCASASVTWITDALNIILGLSVFEVAFCMSVKAIIAMEFSGDVYTLSNIAENPASNESNSLFVGLLLMVLNTLFNLCCMWYFNRIQATNYSDPKSYLLCFECPNSHPPEILDDFPKQGKIIEPDPRNKTPAIQLARLIKYSQDDVIVTETTMNIHSDKITVILGPNGPDKSALIGMITGLMIPSGGAVIVCGVNVVLNKVQARENIGLCPRHDVCFERLTCLEHLTFFHNLKGIEVNDSDVMELLVGIQLAEKALLATVKLSLYEKKLLSIATATIGDPKVVIIDEPSEGLSLAEQHDLWSFLKTLQASRTILVTTINVREAEAIADWTAVIIDGDVRCYGSQEFLKRKYGVGYQLDLLKQPGCHSSKVTSVVLHLIPTASLQEENEKLLRYFLPHDDVSKFAKLLFNLETHTELLNVEIYGIFSTTIDEVFAKVHEGFDPTAIISESDVDQFKKIKQRMKSHTKRAKKKEQIKIEQKKKEMKEKQKVEERKKELLKTEKNQNKEQKIEKPKQEQQNKEKYKRRVKANINENKLEKSSSGSKIDVRPTTRHKTIGKKSSRDSMASSIISAGSSTSINSRQQNLHKGSSATFVNMELHTASSSSEIMDEYAFKKQYKLNNKDISCGEKLKALFVRSFIITKRRWIIRVLQTGTPSLLLLAGLLLDMQSLYNNQSMSLWYTMNKIPASIVQVNITDNTSHELVDIYKHLLKDYHKLIETNINPTLQGSGNLQNKGSELNNIKVYIGVDFTNTSYIHGIALHNIKLHHTKATSLQVLLNANLRCELGHEFLVTSGLVTPEFLQGRADKILCPTTTLGLNLGLVIFSVATISTLIKDRRSQRKQLLELYGVTPVLYWLSTFALDMAVYTVLVLCIIIILSLDAVVFIYDGRWVVVLLVLYLSGVAFLSEVYVLQKFFSVRTNGILFIVILHVFTGVCCSFTLLFWDYTRSRPKYLQGFIDMLAVVLEIISPLYNLTAAILSFPALVTVLRSNAQFADYFEDIEINGVVIGLYRPLVVLLFQSILFWAIVLLTDTTSFKQLCSLNYDAGSTFQASLDSEDDDLIIVKEEMKLAMSHNRMSETSLIVQNLRKCYGKLVAVERTCLMLRMGECFGLLGPRGSGKSTTLRMITGIEPMTRGSVYVKGFNIQEQFYKVRNLLSYTPQYSLLEGHLTGRETLLFFGRLRGIPDDHLQKEVTALLNLLTLDIWEDSQVYTYGVSKQRLLSIAIGFLGQPVLIILDEPSLGLDSAEQKALWALMKKVIENKTTIFFTSQSVEECETVCTNMAIQVAGKLKCLGSPDHLKTKYAVGYTIVVYMSSENYGATFIDKLVDNMQERFPGIRVSERHAEQVHFHLPEVGEKLYEIFHNLKVMKKKFNLDNYLVHETTLEQVYLSFILGQHVRPAKLVPKTKTVTWAEGTRDVINTIPNKYSDYQAKTLKAERSSLTHEDLSKYLKSRFSVNQPK